VLNQFQIGIALLAGATTGAQKAPARQIGVSGLATDSNSENPGFGAHSSNRQECRFSSMPQMVQGVHLGEEFRNTDQEDARQ
jgi:hypothetical protein